jgi:hypothetical protein
MINPIAHCRNITIIGGHRLSAAWEYYFNIYYAVPQRRYQGYFVHWYSSDRYWIRSHLSTSCWVECWIEILMYNIDNCLPLSDARGAFFHEKGIYLMPENGTPDT